MAVRTHLVTNACILAALLAASPQLASAALTFNFTSTGNAQADAGFAAAGARWSNLFSDNITINVTAGFTALGPGILGSTSSTQANYTYSATRAALVADITSPDDIIAASNLPAGSALRLYINRTSTNPNGSGSATPYVDADGDANNTTIRMSNANAKALGLLAPNALPTDAAISFSTAFTWDFNPSNGITPGSYDFVGVAAHEIGHALGFISGVDILDSNSPPVNGPFNDNLFTFVSTLDLFRYSSTSAANSALDWTADNRAKFLSIDGGATALTAFSNGRNFGDGRQASHWKDSLGLGIMDPTFGTGELGVISANDIRAFDLMGYNLAIPEPSSLAILSLSSLLLLRSRKE